MIVEALLRLIYWLFDLLLTPIEIDSLPDNVQTVLTTLISSVESGLGILAAYTHLGYLLTLFSVVIGIDVAMLLYKFIRWIIQKIPMASIE